MNKRALLASLLISGLIFVLGACGTNLNFDYQDVMNSLDTKAKLGNQVAFYLANQPAPAIEKSFRQSIAKRKANSTSDEQSCREALLDALTELRDRALRKGANAVVEVSSYYKKHDLADKTKYECHAGASGARVELKGTPVVLAK